MTVLELREGAAQYEAFFEAETEDLGPENTYLWDIKGEQSRPYLGPTPHERMNRMKTNPA